MKVFRKVACALFVMTLSLSSCVQGDLYDDFYDEDMPSWMMIGRRKFKNDNGDQSNTGSNGGSSGNVPIGGDTGGDLGGDTGGDLGGDTGGDLGGEPTDQNQTDVITQTDETHTGGGWTGGDGYNGNQSDDIPQSGKPTYGASRGTDAYCYLSTNIYDVPSYFSYVEGCYSLGDNEETLKQRIINKTSREEIDKSKITFIMVTENGGEYNLGTAVGLNFKAHKEVGGLYFDDHSTILYVAKDQSLEIKIQKETNQVGGNYTWKVVKSVYQSTPLIYDGINLSGSFSGKQFHTHPDGNPSFSEADENNWNSFGGLISFVVPCAVDDLQNMINNNLVIYEKGNNNYGIRNK